MISFKSKKPLPSAPPPKFSIENATMSSQRLRSSINFGPNLETVLKQSRVSLNSSLTILHIESL